MIKNGDIYLVRFMEAHCFVGRCHWEAEGVTITHPKGLRDWGTQKGMGELYNGPLAGTALDLVNKCFIPRHALICFMALNQAKWEKHISPVEEGGK